MEVILGWVKGIRRFDPFLLLATACLVLLVGFPAQSDNVLRDTIRPIKILWLQHKLDEIPSGNVTDKIAVLDRLVQMQPDSLKYESELKILKQKDAEEKYKQKIAEQKIAAQVKAKADEKLISRTKEIMKGNKWIGKAEAKNGKTIPLVITVEVDNKYMCKITFRTLIDPPKEEAAKIPLSIDNKGNAVFVITGLKNYKDITWYGTLYGEKTRDGRMLNGHILKLTAAGANLSATLRKTQ